MPATAAARGAHARGPVRRSHRLGPGAVHEPRRPRGRLGRQRLRGRWHEQPDPGVHRRTGSSCASSARSAGRGPAELSRTQSRWTRPGTCTSPTAATTGHAVRLGGGLREGLGLGRRQRGRRVRDLHRRVPLRDRDRGQQRHEARRLLRPPGDRRRRRRRRLRVRVRRRPAGPAVRSGADRQLRHRLGLAGSAPGQFARPVGLALDSTPNVFVADRDNSRVQKFTSTGSFLKTIGSLGSGDGQLNVVEDVAVDPAGNLWVAESNNRRVQKFTPAGAFLASYNGYQPGDGTSCPRRSPSAPRATST